MIALQVQQTFLSYVPYLEERFRFSALLAAPYRPALYKYENGNWCELENHMAFWLLASRAVPCFDRRISNLAKVMKASYDATRMGGF